MAQVLINDDNLFGRPAERDGALPQGILARRAFRILEDLLKRTLPDIQTRQALEMARSNLLGHHCGTSRSVSSMSCSRRVSICRSVNRRICALSDILATSPYNLANSRIMMAIEYARRD